MIKKNNIKSLFYLSLLIQIIWRITILLIHELLYKGIGYLPVYGGGVWLFLLLPLSLILGFLLVKKNNLKNWLIPLSLVALTIIFVIAIGFIDF